MPVKRLIILLLFAVEIMLSQDINFVHYNTNNSKLPHDIVYKLMQDKNGFLWICTDDGLIRFDGTDMVSFNKGFRSKYVIDTDEENGRLWISTWKGGIHYLQGDSAIAVKTDNAYFAPFLFSTNNILVFHNLVVSHNFKQYVAFRFDSIKNCVTPFSLKQNPDDKFDVDPEDPEYYWFCKVRQHLYAYDRSGVFDVLESGHLKKINTPVIPDYIWGSPSGQVYFMKGDGIYATNFDFSASSLIYKVPVERFGRRLPSFFKVLPSGNICLAFENAVPRGITPVYFLVNVRTGDCINLAETVTGNVLPADCLLDREGNLWISTDGQGIYHIFDAKYRKLDNKVFSNACINSLLWHNDSLFIGTKEGLYIYRHSVSFVKDPGSHNIYSVGNLFTNEKGHVGLIVFTRNQHGYWVHGNSLDTLSYYRRMIFKDYMLTQFRSGYMTVTERRKNSLYYHHLRIGDNVLNTAEQNGDSLLYLGTNHGLYDVYPASGDSMKKDKRLGDAVINCLCYVAGQGLWAGTNHGLFLLPDHGPLQHWNEKQGLNMNVRCLLQAGDSSLWIGTQNGLFNLKRNQLTIYKKRDDLIADDASCLALMNNNELAVGSSKGITFFVPPKRVLPPSTLIAEEMRTDDTTYSADDNITVSYNSSFSVSYKLVTFVYPELVVYHYRLNQNENWIVTQNSSLVFTNLVPGSYTLEVEGKAYNAGFSKPLMVPFVVLSPWWKSAYFYLLLLGLFLLVIYAYMRWQLKKQRQQALARFELAELKMKALQAQLNPHFISNALNAIQYFILKRDEVAANNYLSQFADLTRLFLEISRKGLVPLSTELKLLDLYLSIEKLRFEDKFSFSVTVDASVHPNTRHVPGLLIQPFVENSINHGLVYLPAKTKGLLAVDIRQTGEFLEITIDDNGIGRHKAREIKSRSTKSYKSRSSQIVDELKLAYNSLPGCEIQIQTVDKTEEASNQPKGTCVYLKIKIHETHIINPTT